MNFTTDLKTRDFSTPVFLSLNQTPLWFSWSAFGGPDSASLRLDGSPENLLDTLNLLRCPITFSDQYSHPVWWGYVDTITINYYGVKFLISIDTLYNKVKVSYSFISPDNKLADRYDTAFSDFLASQVDFGVREITLEASNIDDDFALDLRDTFLSLHAWPRTVLTTSDPAHTFAELHCSGWFSTLGWQTYENLDGFYANYGPGPGTINFGRPNWRLPVQRFTPGADCDVKYVYFQLRKNGVPPGNLQARIYTESGGFPNTFTSSATIAASTLPATGYTWTRFTFDPVVALAAGSHYWASCYSSVSDAANNIFMRLDENANYYQPDHYARYSDVGVWKVIPNITSPGTYPHLIFRVVCLSDTGSQLLDISTSGNQFFTDIFTLATSVNTSAYRAENKTCFDEIIEIMKLGTTNNRMVLANVDHNRRLTFYEQPSTTPTAFMDRSGKFYSLQGIPLRPYFPPVGQFVYFRGSNRLSLPFDQYRIPSTFVETAKYNCLKGTIKINNS